MATYEMEISRVQRRRVEVVADSFTEAQAKAREGFRVILVDNQNPWEYEQARVELLDVYEEGSK